MRLLRAPNMVQRHAWSVLDRLHDGHGGLGSRWIRHPEVALALRALDRECQFTSWADDETKAPGEGMRRHIALTCNDVPEPNREEIRAGCALAEELIIAAEWELSGTTPVEVITKALDEVLDPMFGPAQAGEEL